MLKVLEPMRRTESKQLISLANCKSSFQTASLHRLWVYFSKVWDMPVTSPTRQNQQKFNMPTKQHTHTNT